MDFHDVFSAVKPAESPDSKATTNITQIPANIVGALVPGYSTIAKPLSEYLGLDISLLVSGSLLIFGLITTGTFWKKASVHFETLFTSIVIINSDDDIYNHVMEWLVEQPISKNSRSLMARTTRGQTYDLENWCYEKHELNSGHLLNFRNAKVAPSFQPYFGNHIFRHRGRYFVFSREFRHQTSVFGSLLSQDEIIKLRCYGWSTRPIKDLIRECGDHYSDTRKSCTDVRRPAHVEIRNKGRALWGKKTTSLSRPIGTVVLDHKCKEDLLRDINNYLHPDTSKWYANHGIPYRRGYLFHGPPGTGKSSLAWAIAGVFGLEIYLISLAQGMLSDDDLHLMFTDLPRRCIVLLEDIDSAGLAKRQKGDKIHDLGSEDAVAEIGSETTETLNQEHRTTSRVITLSGLLNAIDGVASHEGRILIMTSNFPDRLDEALIRPGRIDVQVAFKNATRPQIHEIFVRMYSPDISTKPASNIRQAVHKLDCHSTGDSTPSDKATSEINKEETPAILPQSIPAASSAAPKLEEIATEFANLFDEETFTPAEIQGFLLTKKEDPVEALKEGPAWKDQVLKTRRLQ
ncbi:hypothetical protein ABVK25_010783 [Lepraria finkii]|uniref:Mitochondrial chaperone BCS1 n=1 Tax=Lepraria finkii TaxID=1340010 RepID=A0ABR4AUI4_9LECA